jgi:hypothetical protein
MKAYKKAIDEILLEIANRIPDGHKQYPIKSYIVGGVACYLLTQARASDDIDMIISNRIELPQDLFVIYIDENKKFKKLYFDSNYNGTLGLMQEDYEDRAILYKNIQNKFKVFILNPIDLIITKILRYTDKDENDIKSLIFRFDINKDELIRLSNDAISVGVGFDKNTANINLEKVLEILTDK